MTVIVPVERPRRAVEMRPSDIHCFLHVPPHRWCDVLCQTLAVDAVLRFADETLLSIEQRRHDHGAAFLARFEAAQFGRSPIEKLRRRRSIGALMHGLEPQGLDADAVECHLRALRDPARAAWMDKMCLTPQWRSAGIGIARADVRADGFWDFWPDADVAGSKSGTAVLTIPEFDGDSVVEIFAIELAPGATQRRTGRVFRHTGLAAGLGIDTFDALEWRHNSTRLALVASPLDWVRRFDAVSNTGASSVRFVPLLDGQPCAWLVGLDEAHGLTLDASDQQRLDDLLCAADPILIDGTDPDFTLCVQAALDRARRRRMPPKPELMVWTPDDSSNAKEHAA